MKPVIAFAFVYLTCIIIWSLLGLLEPTWLSTAELDDDQLLLVIACVAVTVLFSSLIHFLHGEPLLSRLFKRSSKKPIGACRRCTKSLFADSREDSLFLSCCGHRHCRLCVEDAFNLACRDRNSYPPRCCNPDGIPLSTARQFLSNNLIRAYANTVDNWEPVRLQYLLEETSCVTCNTPLPKRRQNEDARYCLKCIHFSCVYCKGPQRKDENHVMRSSRLECYLEERHKNALSALEEVDRLATLRGSPTTLRKHEFRALQPVGERAVGLAEAMVQEDAARQLARKRHWQTCGNCECIIQRAVGCGRTRYATGRDCG